MGWIKQHWQWEHVVGDTYRTRDGVLRLGEDGAATITAAAKRAWQAWLWRQESRAKLEPDHDRHLDTHHPSIQGHSA